MSSKRRTRHNHSPNQTDRIEHLEEELNAFYRSERRTARALLAWCFLSLVAGYLLFRSDQLIMCGIASPLVFFIAPITVISLRVLRYREPDKDELTSRPEVRQEEQIRMGLIIQKRRFLITATTWLLCASLIVVVISAIARSTGLIIGIGIGVLIQSAVSLAVLLVSTFRSEVYQHALHSVDKD